MEGTASQKGSEPAIDRESESSKASAPDIASARTEAPDLGTTSAVTPPATKNSDPTDPYSWLEPRRDEKVAAWVTKENDRTFSALKADPRFSQYYKKASDISAAALRIPGISSGTLAWLHDGSLYHVERDARHPQGLMRRASLGSFLKSAPVWEDLLDIGTLGVAGSTTVTMVGSNCFASRCMLAFNDGDPALMWREFDLLSRAFVKGGFELRSTVIPVWADADTLILGCDFLTQSEHLVASQKAASVVRWNRGQPLEAAATIYKAPNPEQLALVGPLEVHDDPARPRPFILQMNKAGTEKKYLQIGRDWRVTPMNIPDDAGIAVYKDKWVIVLNADISARGDHFKAGSIVAIREADLANTAPLIELVLKPGERETIDSIVSTKTGVFAIGHMNVRGRVFKLRPNKSRWERQDIELPEYGDINLAFPTSVDGDELLVKYESFLDPTRLYQIDAVSRAASVVIQNDSQFDAASLITEQFETRSTDGTRVPYFVVRPKALIHDGHAPTLLTAYGGNGRSFYPHYDPVLGRLWLESGGVYVQANIRGGSEFGPAWHATVTKQNRQRAFDDFAAVANDLIRRRITSSRRLGITGHSNGGGLVAIASNQHPNLFAAVIAENGVLDWIRTDLQWGAEMVEEERGSPTIPNERAFLDRVSPYQNVRARPDAPEFFVVTNSTDHVVYPAMSRKFAAKLAELRRPYYFYEAPAGGHGQYSTDSERALYTALKFTFLMRALGGSELRAATSAR